jgi:dihydrofolate reductase
MPMRKVIYGGACSLDGFLADATGQVDWLLFSKDVQAIMAKSWATADTVLFGRKTWQVAQAMGGGPTGLKVKSYVFSKTLTSLPAGAAELVSEDAGPFVRALKQQPGKDMIVMSGGNLARSLFQAGVIDEVGLNIHPILLGSGVPAFVDAGVRIALEHVECRTLEGGCVLVNYRVQY